MSIKVIGAGYGRTGTKSMHAALQELGFNKCHHMVEVFQNPETIEYWEKAYKKQKVDWDKVFEGYQAVVDFPGSIYYKQIADHYPDAKVILTVRDPESWYKSTLNTIFNVDPGILAKLKLSIKAIFSQHSRYFIRIFKMIDKTIWEGLFEGRFEDKEYAINNFNNNTKEVQEYIAPDRLLVFNVKDGWEPLCKFLDVPVPSTPFPNTNKSEDFKEMFNAISKSM